MRIAVLYPRGQKTGGPEAMHQFVHELRQQSAEAFVCPHPSTERLARAEAFSAYNAPELRWGELREDDLLVGAEIYAHELLTAPTRNRVMWWLSVDNGDPFRFTLMVRDRFRRRESTADGVPRLIVRLAREQWWRWRIKRNRSIRHIAQSAYAAQFITRWTGRETPVVSDYIVLAEPQELVTRNANRVAFNPAKGGALVAQVAAGLDDLEFVPLTGMTPEAMVSALQSSAVYLDLGHHPGKDRIPREAAVLGCAVVVAARGSARLDDDVPLENRFKIDPHDLVGSGRRVLRDTIDALPQSVAAQEPLRERIRAERSTFSDEVASFRAEFVRPA